VNDPPTLFALDSSKDLGARVAERMGIALSPHEVRDFDGGEHKSRPLVNVRGRSAVVLASLDAHNHLSANDKLCRLLFFIGALKQASASSVCAVVPYLCYSRKDRQSKARDPVTTRYVAQLFEAVGADHVVTLDVHNFAAFQNAFRCPTDHLEAASVFATYLRDRTQGQNLVVVSPDIGGVKRAARFRDVLADTVGKDMPIAFTEKFRSRGLVYGRDEVLGEVEDRVAIVYDDIISSGTTMGRVASALRRQRAASVIVAATHGLFTPDSSRLFESPAVSEVVVTDSVTGRRLPANVLDRKLVVLTIERLLAETIDRLHRGGSLVDLLHLEN